MQIYWDARAPSSRALGARLDRMHRGRGCVWLHSPAESKPYAPFVGDAFPLMSPSFFHADGVAAPVLQTHATKCLASRGRCAWNLNRCWRCSSRLNALTCWSDDSRMRGRQASFQARCVRIPAVGRQVPLSSHTPSTPQWMRVLFRSLTDATSSGDERHAGARGVTSHLLRPEDRVSEAPWIRFSGGGSLVHHACPHQAQNHRRPPRCSDG